MNKLYYILCFLLVSGLCFAQTEELVPVFLSKGDLDYIKVKSVSLGEKYDIVSRAHTSGDNGTISDNKSEIAMIVHNGPVILMNLVHAAKNTLHNPDTMGSRFENGIDGYLAMMRDREDYFELELLPIEVDLLADKALKADRIKKDLVASNYAIHASQEGTRLNIDKLNELSQLMEESIEIFKAGLHR